jgi:hypothetical protein
MLVDKKYSYNIAKGSNFNRVVKVLPAVCVGENFVSAVELMLVGSTIKVECACEKCGISFERQARQIKERDAGDKFCTKCAFSLGSTGRKHSQETKNLCRDTHLGKVLTQEQKDHRKLVRTRNKHTYKPRKKVSVEGYMCGDKNPAWVEKSGFKLFTYLCKEAKKRYMKEHNLTSSRDCQVRFKMNLETAYRIGMDPGFVGTHLVVMTQYEAGLLNACQMNSVPRKKSPRKPLMHIKEYRRYVGAVIRLSNILYEENKEIINPDNLPRGQQAKGNNNYHLDHIVPINICWKEGVMGEFCASLDNLRLIPWQENISKNGKMLDEYTHLLESFKIKTKEHQDGRICL